MVTLPTLRRPAAEFWRGKRVLLTGHTGFKGGWLALWLHRLGAEVHGISLAPVTEPNLFACAGIASILHHHLCDIRDLDRLVALVRTAAPEIVLHLAAQPLVRASYTDPVGTLASNFMGTTHLLEAVRHCDDARVVLAITTDKVYRNLETTLPFKENDALGGHDPYSASKAAAEIVVASYRDAFLKNRGIAVASARAGNVIGGGDWSPDRLLPDALRAWQDGQPLLVRRPDAVRPWQHVLEPLNGYLLLAEHLWHTPNDAAAFNFGPATDEAASVREVIELARTVYGSGMVEWGDGTGGPHEAGWLALDTAKIRALLGLAPHWRLTESVRRSVEWYRRFEHSTNARALCNADIDDFEAGR
ncbi:MAG: CDP-glucose 4,6-dehydratase [Pseudomonadota bacterium]